MDLERKNLAECKKEPVVMGGEIETANNYTIKNEFLSKKRHRTPNSDSSATLINPSKNSQNDDDDMGKVYEMGVHYFMDNAFNEHNCSSVKLKRNIKFTRVDLTQIIGQKSFEHFTDENINELKESEQVHKMFKTYKLTHESFLSKMQVYLDQVNQTMKVNLKNQRPKGSQGGPNSEDLSGKDEKLASKAITEKSEQSEGNLRAGRKGEASSDLGEFDLVACNVPKENVQKLIDSFQEEKNLILLEKQKELESEHYNILFEIGLNIDLSKDYQENPKIQQLIKYLRIIRVLKTVKDFGKIYEKEYEESKNTETKSASILSIFKILNVHPFYNKSQAKKALDKAGLDLDNPTIIFFISNGDEDQFKNMDSETSIDNVKKAIGGSGLKLHEINVQAIYCGYIRFPKFSFDKLSLVEFKKMIDDEWGQKMKQMMEEQENLRKQMMKEQENLKKQVEDLKKMMEEKNLEKSPKKETTR